MAGRATLLLVALCLMLGCTQETSAPSQKRERVQAVKPAAAARTLEGFCDKSFPANIAPPLALPSFSEVPSGRVASINLSGHWAWINVWATFCAPCLREMDMLMKWRGQLAATVAPVDLLLVSVDESMDDVKAYLARQPGVRALPNFLARERGPLESALKPLGLGSLDSIPMHIFVAPDGTVRCTRAGALNDDDYHLIKNLVESGLSQ